LLPVGAQPQPTGEVLDGGPLGEVGAQLADQGQSVQLLDAFDLGQIDAHQVVERPPHIETRVVGLAATLARPGGQGGQFGLTSQGVQLQGNHVVELGNDLEVLLPDCQVELQLQDVLETITPVQGGGDLGDAVLTTSIAELGQLVGIAF